MCQLSEAFFSLTNNLRILAMCYLLSNFCHTPQNILYILILIPSAYLVSVPLVPILNDRITGRGQTWRKLKPEKKRKARKLEKRQNGAELLTGWRSEIFKSSQCFRLEGEKCGKKAWRRRKKNIYTRKWVNKPSKRGRYGHQCGIQREEEPHRVSEEEIKVSKIRWVKNKLCMSWPLDGSTKPVSPASGCWTHVKGLRLVKHIVMVNDNFPIHSQNALALEGWFFFCLKWEVFSKSRNCQMEILDLHFWRVTLKIKDVWQEITITNQSREPGTSEDSLSNQLMWKLGWGYYEFSEQMLI